MSGTKSQNSSKREVLLKTVSTWDNEKFGALNIKTPEATVLKITIDPGEALPAHRHDLVNIAYVAKGTLTVIADDGQQITIQQGQVLPELIGKYHYGRNDGTEPVELIVFYLGEQGTPLSVPRE